MKPQKRTSGVDSPCHWVAPACGMAALALGAVALAAWMFDIPVFRSVVPGWIPTRPPAALGFALLGGALWLLRRNGPGPREIAVARGCAAAVVLIGLLTLGGYLARAGWRIDPLFLKESDPDVAIAGRMTMKSTLNQMLLGAALLLLDRVRPQWVQGLGLVVGSTVYLALIGYLSGAGEAGGIGSLHSHLAFLLLAVGVVAAPGDAGFMALVRNQTAWIFIRRLVPAVLFVPIILNWLRLWGQQRGLYGTELGVELLVVLSALILVTLILWSAQTARVIDSFRAEAEAERYRLNQLMDHVPDRIYFKDLDGRFLRNNRAHLARFGLTEQAQALGKTDSDFFPEEHARRAREDDLRVMAGGQPLITEEKISWQDGRVEWASIVKMPLRDPNGKVFGLFGISHDITARKRVDAELEKMTNRLLLATRAASIGVWDFDPVGDSLVWDEQMFRIYGITADQFPGTFEGWQAMVHPDDVGRESELIRRTLGDGRDYDSDFRVVWPDKSVHYVKANAIVQRDESGRAVHMIGTNWDITEPKRMEEELARSNADLAQFASIASHDLQEPLRAVAGCVELLEKGYRDQLDDAAGELIQHTLDGTRRMQTLIRDLLEYSRVDTRGRPLAPTDANAVLDDALRNLAIALRESDAVVARDALPTVNADPRQLTQLFQNLIANGIKFCGGRRPEIHVGAEYKNGAWQFSVRDNGIGIEPQYLERIFVIFQRLHTRTEYPGTGIGLAICKRIVERHQGRIWVESEPGGGSTFYFTLAEPTPAP